MVPTPANEEMSEGTREIKLQEDLIKAVRKYSAIGRDRVKQEAQDAKKDEDDFYVNFGLTSEDLLPIKAGEKESKKRIEEKRRHWKEHLLKTIPEIKDYILLNETENEEVSASDEEVDKNSEALVILETPEDTVSEKVVGHKVVERVYPELPEVGLYSEISALNFDTKLNVWEKVNNRVVDKNRVITAEDYNSSEYYYCINEIARPEEQAWTSTYLNNFNNIQGHVKKIVDEIYQEFPEYIEEVVMDFDYLLDPDPEEDNFHWSDNDVAEPEPEKDDDPFAGFSDENTNTSSGQTNKRMREVCDSDDDFEERPVSIKESKKEKAAGSGGGSLSKKSKGKSSAETGESSEKLKKNSKEDEEPQEVPKKGKRTKRKNSEKEDKKNEKEIEAKKPYATRASRMLALCEPSTSREEEVARVSPEAPKPSTSGFVLEEPKPFKMPNPSGGTKKRLAPILSSKAFMAKKKLNSKYGIVEEEVEKELNMMYEEDPKMKHSEEKEMEIDKEIGDSQLPLELFPKSEDAVELFREYKKNCSSLGLLDTLYQILCYTSSLRLSPYFDPLFMSIVDLMRVMFQKVIDDSNIVIDFMMSMIREILYCRPSNPVLLGIQAVLVIALDSDRAIQQLCHNPSTQMSLLEKSSLYFYKGTCILQVMCHQVNRLSPGVMERYWDLCYLVMSWVFKIFQFHLGTLARMWYLQPPHLKLCKCVHLFHTMIFRILNRVAFHYNIETNYDLKESTKVQMERIMLGGIELTKTLLEADSRFAVNLKRGYLNFAGYIRLMRQMQESKISLEQDDVEWLDRLLKEEQMKRVIDATERQEKLKRAWREEEDDDGVTWEEWEAERRRGEDFTEGNLSHNLWEAVTKSELEGRSLPLEDLDEPAEDQLDDTQVEERIDSLEQKFGRLTVPRCLGDPSLLQEVSSSC